MEPLELDPIEETRPLSLVNIPPDPIPVVKTLLGEMKTRGLREFIPDPYEDEANTSGYYLPSNPEEYKNDSRIAKCIGQSSVTIKKWYERIREYMPDLYLIDEHGRWTIVSIVELTDYGMCCCDELPERDRSGRPRTDETGKLIKVKNPFLQTHGWENFYRPLLEKRWQNYQASLCAPAGTEIQVYKPKVVNVFDIEKFENDDSWMNQSGLSTDVERNQEAMQRLRGVRGLGVRVYKELSPQYRNMGRVVGTKLAGQFYEGIDEGQQASGIESQNNSETGKA